MSPLPSPRPALGRPGSVKAAKRAAGKPVAPDPPVVSPLQDKKLVELVVPLPKDVRKLVKEKAERLGVGPEEAVYRVLLSWVQE